MHIDEFMAWTHSRQKECSCLLVGVKNTEYSRNDDKLHNFKRAGALLGCTPHEALVGMWSKHLISILDMVSDYAASGKIPTSATIDEKFTDAINYLHLLEALFRESQSVNNNAYKTCDD